MEIDSETQVASGKRTIKIELCGYGHIVSTFSLGDLFVEGQFLNTPLGTSPRIPATHDEFISTSHLFTIDVDTLSISEMNDLISNPVVFSTFECPGADNPNAQISLSEILPAKMTQVEKLSLEEAAKLHEAYTGNQLSFINLDVSRQSSLGSASKGSVSTSTLPISIGTVSNVPRPLGVSTLDLYPIFNGHNDFMDCLPIHPEENYMDDRMLPAAIFPYLSIRVTLMEPDGFLSPYNSYNIVNLTIESIFNVPLTIMNSTFKICTYMPHETQRWETQVFPEGVASTSKPPQETVTVKWWPSKARGIRCLAWAMKERIKECWEDVRDPMGINLRTMHFSDGNRIEWNTMKRMFLNEDASVEFKEKLEEYRRLIFEIYVESNEPARHFMAIADVSNLLLPGERICRIVCPLYVYMKKEVIEKTGMTRSEFVVEEPTKIETQTSRKGNKPDSKKTSDKGSKGGKGAGGSLRSKLIMPPVVLEEQLIPLMNEDEKQSFLVVEIEVVCPLFCQRTIPDLTNKLNLLMSPPPTDMRKLVCCSNFADAHFRQVLHELIYRICRKHGQFLKANQQCKCGFQGANDFMYFLRDTEDYEKYLCSLTESAIIIANSKFALKTKIETDYATHKEFIANIFTYLIKQTNNLVLEIAPNTKQLKLNWSDSLLFYAKEACELGADALADRYHLERICQEPTSAIFWLDYAIFQLEIENEDKAFECVCQSLKCDSSHTYSLLLYGIMLAAKDRPNDAEICFLTTLSYHAKWAEAWGVCYLFNCQFGKRFAAKFCLDNALKYCALPARKCAYSLSDDLIWTGEFTPPTLFYKTCVLLIKLRAYDYAGRALAAERDKTSGLFSYYQGVIAYYRHHYRTAINLLKNAQTVYGNHYTIVSLLGHCYTKLDMREECEEAYLSVLRLYDKPADLHMVYVYFALALEKRASVQIARKIILIACKVSPTPYTWLGAGLLFYRQGDLLSAEECFTNGNLLDNRLPEIWAYLTIVNVKLNRLIEAEMCWEQALKVDISDKLIELLASAEPLS